jgi:hypothetical protein
MKSRSGFTLSNLVCLCLVSLLIGCSPAPVPEPTPSPTASREYSLVSHPFQEKGENPPYTINAEIPYLQDSTLEAVEPFNQLVEALVREDIDRFRSSVLQSATNPPISVGSSYDLRYDQLAPEGNLISLKFTISSYFDGAAHPGEQILTFNYDLSGEKQLNLGQLFKPGSDYLNQIAAYCKGQLSQRDIGYSESGADATSENYRNWNITADGLLITFDMYQVAAGAAGSQTVLVAYADLKSMINDQGPLDRIPK